jgi:hypothetical protein
MVDISIGNGQVVFSPRGLSKLWSLRCRVTVPVSAIRRVRRAAPGVSRGWWKGWRLPGTHLPGVIIAGSYLRDGEWEFWDVRGAGRRAIEVDLSGVRFSRLVIDVDDPDAAVRRLEGART